jgi:hypothetical protein
LYWTSVCRCSARFLHRVYISWTFIVNIYNAELVNTTHGFYWRWDVLHAKRHGYPWKDVKIQR